MALYGGSRDISFFNHINKELLEDVIEQVCSIYKISLNNTAANIYGESSEKIYADPVLLNCLITRGEQNTGDDDFGPDRKRSNSFAFYRRHLVDANIVPEIGDIILWQESYYEIDNLIENQLTVGKSPDYPSDTPYLNTFGKSWSIIAVTHLTREDKLNLKKSR